MRAPVELGFPELGDHEVEHPSHRLAIRQPRGISFAEMKIDLVGLGQTELRAVLPPVTMALLKSHCAAPGEVNHQEVVRRDAPAADMVAG